MADHDASVGEFGNSTRLDTKGPTADFAFYEMNCGICHF
jgi:hypothetical protein